MKITEYRINDHGMIFMQTLHTYQSSCAMNSTENMGQCGPAQMK